MKNGLLTAMVALMALVMFNCDGGGHSGASYICNPAVVDVEAALAAAEPCEADICTLVYPCGNYGDDIDTHIVVDVDAAGEVVGYTASKELAECDPNCPTNPMWY